MQSKVKAAPTYVQIANKNTSVELLKLIKYIAFTYFSQKCLPHAIHDTNWRFFLQFQVCQLNVKDYLE